MSTRHPSNVRIKWYLTYPDFHQFVEYDSFVDLFDKSKNDFQGIFNLTILTHRLGREYQDVKIVYDVLYWLAMRTFPKLTTTTDWDKQRNSPDFLLRVYKKYSENRDDFIGKIQYKTGKHREIILKLLEYVEERVKWDGKLYNDVYLKMEDL